VKGVEGCFEGDLDLNLVNNISQRENITFAGAEVANHLPSFKSCKLTSIPDPC
jgi:hypothetical protein